MVTSERQEQAPTRLYDQRGDSIRNASRLDTVLDDADDAVWLVPAMVLTESTGEAAADRQMSAVPTTQELDCQNYGRATDHRFKTHESVLELRNRVRLCLSQAVLVIAVKKRVPAERMRSSNPSGFHKN